MINQEQLDKILDEHKLWLKDNDNAVKANLSNLDLSNLDFKGRDLRCISFQGANLTNCNFSCCNLANTDFSWSILKGAKLNFANLFNSQCCNADFEDAKMQGTNLEQANLSFANLTNVDLYACKLYCTNLQGITWKYRIFQISELGDMLTFIYFIPQDNKVLTGTWNGGKGGTLEEFKQATEKIYGKEGTYPNQKYYNEFQAVIKCFEILKEDY